MNYRSVRGTKDIFFPEVKFWQYLENFSNDFFTKYGYSQIRVPIFEFAGLFQHSIGKLTDIVEKEMYIFPDRKSRLLALRPEGTAGVVRAIIEKNLVSDNQIGRFFYCGPMFRYEKPQRGRQRQFHQIGIELVGIGEPIGDAEVISLNFWMFKELGLKNLNLYLNNVGCFKCRPSYRDALQKYYLPLKDKLCSDCQRRVETNPLRLLDCKNQQCQKYKENAPLITDYLCAECKSHFTETLHFLSDLGIDYKIDYRLVRGLDYYTRTIFEIKEKHQEAISAGGRYDNLFSQLGGKDLPAVGFALGEERLLEEIFQQKISLSFPLAKKVYISCLGKDAQIQALKISNQLSSQKFNFWCDFSNRSLKSQLRQADKTCADFVIIIGENEIKQGKYIFKNMETGEQKDYTLEQLREFFQ